MLCEKGILIFINEICDLGINIYEGLNHLGLGLDLKRKPRIIPYHEGSNICEGYFSKAKKTIKLCIVKT